MPARFLFTSLPWLVLARPYEECLPADVFQLQTAPDGSEGKTLFVFSDIDLASRFMKSGFAEGSQHVGQSDTGEEFANLLTRAKEEGVTHVGVDPGEHLLLAAEIDEVLAEIWNAIASGDGER